MIPPIVTVSEELNQKSAAIEVIEKKMARYQTLIAIFDHNLRERIGVAKEAAEHQHQLLKEFLTQTRQIRDYGQLSATYNDRLATMRRDYLQSFESIVDAKDSVAEQGSLIALTDEKIEQLRQKFIFELDVELEKCRHEFVIDAETDLTSLQKKVNERIQARSLVIEAIYTDKQKLTTEYLTFETKVSTQYEALLTQREKLKNGLEVRDIFTATQLNAIQFIQDGLKERWLGWTKKNFVNQKHPNGFSALHTAAYLDRIEIMQLLIGADADFRIQDQNGYCPLHRAAQTGAYLAARLLLNHNAEVDPKGEYKRTPLHMSVFNSQLDVTRLLLERRAEINRRTSKEDGKQTSLHLAVFNGDINMVRLLTQNALLDVNLPDKNGYAPLYYAVKEGLVEIASRILNHASWKNGTSDDPNSLDQLLKMQPKRETEAVANLLRTRKTLLDR